MKFCVWINFVTLMYIYSTDYLFPCDEILDLNDTKAALDNILEQNKRHLHCNTQSSSKKENVKLQMEFIFTLINTQ